MYDAIIIGAGPSGLTAAIYLLRASKKVLIIEKEGVGGQIASSSLIENYPGFSKISGSEFASNMFEQVMALGADFEIDEVIKITESKEVITKNKTYEGKTIIIATGSKYRRLNLENEDKFIGKGIHFCVSCDGAFYKDKQVAIVGGGNTAVGNAFALSEICKKVYIIQNLPELTCDNMSKEIIMKKDNVEIITNVVVDKYLGDERLEGVVLNSGKEIKLDGLFLAIGLVPQNEAFKHFLDTDNFGYAIADNTKTRIEGIYVAGDVVRKSVRQLTTATSDGTIAAINAIGYLNG